MAQAPNTVAIFANAPPDRHAARASFLSKAAFVNSRRSSVFRVPVSQDLSESNMLIIDAVVKYEQFADCLH
ncbi:hypothetical protein [Trinickia mobilis]|uniref:hypothetical protein n=1 Tax=Trinickia mobilis TaxID=2816356 RepID=UPI001A8DAE0E|nr:hypothetical protein [Trinickia mobilis]